MDNYPHNNNEGRDNRGGGDSGNNRNRNHSTLIVFIVVTLVTLLIMSFVNNSIKDSTSQEITYSQFLSVLEAGGLAGLAAGGAEEPAGVRGRLRLRYFWTLACW